MKGRKTIFILTFLVMSVAVFITACGSKSTNSTSVDDSKDKDYVIKLGYYNCDHMTSACIGKDAGIFDKLGLKVEVTGNGKVPEAMAAGKMDVGYVGIRGLIQAQLKGSPIMVAANNHVGGSEYLVVANNIKKPEDLLGKKLGIGSDPLTNESWYSYTKHLKLPLEAKNYEAIQFGGDKDKYLALKSGNISGFTCCDPWASMAEYEKTGWSMDTYWKKSDSGDWTTCCVFGMNIKFAEEHPQLAKKMLLAHTQSMEYIYLHPVKAAKIFAKNYSVPEEVALMTIYKKTIKEGRTLTWVTDEKQITGSIDRLLSIKLIDKKPEYSKLVQTKLLAESGADDFDKFIKSKVDPVFPLGMSYEQWKQKALDTDK